MQFRQQITVNFGVQLVGSPNAEGERVVSITIDDIVHLLNQ